MKIIRCARGTAPSTSAVARRRNVVRCGARRGAARAALLAAAALIAPALSGCRADKGVAQPATSAESAQARVPARYLTDATSRSADKLPGLLEPLTQKTASHADDALAWRDLGIVRARLGLYKDARAALDRAAQPLADDPYLAGYRALTLEMLGELAAAAKEYQRAAPLLPTQAAGLRGRAGLLRARALRGPVGDDAVAAGPATIALLRPIDLGGDAGVKQAPAAIAVALELGLRAAMGVSVIAPDRTEAWLAADHRAPADFDDPQARAAAAKSLASRGVEQVMATSFLVIEDGSTHVRTALIPVTTSGAGTPASPDIAPGAKGHELLPLAGSLGEVWKAAGVAPAKGEPAAWMPTSLAGAQSLADGLRALDAGDYPVASQAFGRLAAAFPQLAAASTWRDATAAAAPVAANPLTSKLGTPGPVADMLTAHARQARKQLEEGKRGSDVPF